MGIGGTFLCDYFINKNDDKPWISNVILLGFFAVSCIFVFLFDEKLDRQEIDKAGREKEQKKEENNNNNGQVVTIEVTKK